MIRFDLITPHSLTTRVVARGPSESDRWDEDRVHSKMVHNHILAQALYFFFYNWIRPHMTLTARNGDKRTTPAMAAGLAKTPLSWAYVLRRLDAETPGTPARTLPQGYTTEGTSEQCAATPRRRAGTTRSGVQGRLHRQRNSLR